MIKLIDEAIEIVYKIICRGWSKFCSIILQATLATVMPDLGHTITVDYIACHKLTKVYYKWIKQDATLKWPVVTLSKNINLLCHHVLSILVKRERVMVEGNNLMKLLLLGLEKWERFMQERNINGVLGFFYLFLIKQKQLLQKWLSIWESIINAKWHYSEQKVLLVFFNANILFQVTPTFTITIFYTRVLRPVYITSQWFCSPHI